MTNKAGPKFRFLCFGVGAMGTYLGGSLLNKGHHVAFIDRPKNAEKVRKNGLHLTFDNQTYDIENPDVIPTIEEGLTHGPFDAAIFAVKGYDTDHVLKYLLPYQVALPPFICIQDGIGNEARLVNVLGPDKVIPAVITTTVRKTGLGRVTVLHERGIGMSGTHQLTAAIIDAFNQTGLRVRRYRDATSMKWSKLLFSLMTNASAAILQMTPEEIIQDPELRQIEIRQIQETLRVMESQHIRVVNLPGFPIRWLNMLMSENVSTKLRDYVLINMVVEQLGNVMPLLAEDLKNEKRDCEVSTLNSAVVRHALQSDISTPVNAALSHLLTGIVAGKINPQIYYKNKAAFVEFIQSFPMPSIY